jgi:hypothetical protein
MVAPPTQIGLGRHHRERVLQERRKPAQRTDER